MYTIRITTEEPNGTTHSVEVQTDDDKQFTRLMQVQFPGPTAQSAEAVADVTIAIDPTRLEEIFATPDRTPRRRGRPVRHQRVPIEKWERIRPIIARVKPELLVGIISPWKSEREAECDNPGLTDGSDESLPRPVRLSRDEAGPRTLVAQTEVVNGGD